MSSTKRPRPRVVLWRLVGLRLLYVEWVDSHYRPGWTTDDASSEPLKCVSVGWLIKEDAEGMTLSSNLSVEENKQRCGDITIPTRAILRTKRLL